MNQRCKFPDPDGFHTCGSHAFNLHHDEIDQGELCDTHYWQSQADRLKALNAELAAVLETIVRDADGRRISGNLILDENSPVIVAARAVLAEHKGETA